MVSGVSIEQRASCFIMIIQRRRYGLSPSSSFRQPLTP